MEKQTLTRKEMRRILSWMQNAQRKAMFNPALDVTVHTQYTKANDRPGTLDAWSLRIEVWDNRVEEGRYASFHIAAYNSAEEWAERQEEIILYLAKFGISVYAL